MINRDNGWVYHRYSGMKITFDYTAELGLIWKPGTTISIMRDGEGYTNFTVDEFGIKGDQIAPTLWAYHDYIGYCYPDTSFSVELGDEFASRDDKEYKVALYLTNVEPATEVDTSVTKIGILLMDVDNPGSYVNYYYTTNNTPSQNVPLSNDISLRRIDLNSGQNYDFTSTTYYIFNQVIDGVPAHDFFNYVAFSTNIPLFDSDVHAKSYLLNDTTEGCLNLASNESYESAYENTSKKWYVRNIFGHNSRSMSGYTGYRNYIFKPKNEGDKICFFKRLATSNSPYDLKLINYDPHTIYSGGVSDVNEEEYSIVQEIEEYFLMKSKQFSDNDFYGVFKFQTNIPIFKSQLDAQKYENDEIDITDALNWNDIARAHNDLLGPQIGEYDESTELGVNGQNYAAGSCFWALSERQMATFFVEIYTNQNVFQAIKDGNQLFGENTMDAIFGCMYLPIRDISAVAGVGGDTKIRIGGWISDHSEGKKISSNEGVIDCGTVYYEPIYNDVRDYEPYTELFIQLPYCGTYQLSIQKYIGKNINIKYAVDIFTGACTAYIFADGIMLDSMDGMMGVQRPVTGRTAANMVSSVLGGLTGAAGGAGAAIKGASKAYAFGSGVNDLAIAGAIPGVSAGATGAGVGAAVGIGATAAVGVGGALAAAAVGTYAMYKAKSAMVDPPMESRGSYTGNLGLFGTQKIHLIFAMKRTIRPDSELDLVGYPSGVSGRIGEFSGFLKSNCIYLADGFIGSSQERAEILEMIGKGIYI